jgi:creatinine amidohydrolase/Fe(II)-dependent formamide hydrolase-like protein
VADVTRIDLSRVASPEVEAAVPGGVRAVPAAGACGQQGAPLPLTTGTDMAQGQAAEIADAPRALLLPPVIHGDARTEEARAGRLSAPPQTLLGMLTDFGRGLLRMAVRGLVIVKGRLGKRAPLVRAAEVIAGVGLPVLPFGDPGPEAPFATISDSAPAGQGFRRAEACRARAMLATVPDAVSLDRAGASCPAFPTDVGRVPMPRRRRNPTGVPRDPHPAMAAGVRAAPDGMAAEWQGLVALRRGRHGI